MHYQDEFLQLKCAPDVLAAVGNIGTKAAKEITEAMAIIKKIKKYTHDDDYLLVDVCSGNALVPVIAAHLLPLTWAYAIDIQQRERRWDMVKQFDYLNMDIHQAAQRIEFIIDNDQTILTGVHCCGELAIATIKMYNNIPSIKHLVLMPCCVGHLKTRLQRSVKELLGVDMAWVLRLAHMCDGDVQITQDKHILSPKNYIITATKTTN